MFSSPSSKFVLISLRAMRLWCQTWVRDLISSRRFSSHHSWRDSRSGWASESRCELATFVSRKNWGHGGALVRLCSDFILFRIVVGLFDRERLITGSRAPRAPSGGGQVPPAGAIRRIPRTGESDHARLNIH